MECHFENYVEEKLVIGACNYLPQSLEMISYHRKFYREADSIWNEFGIHLSLSLFFKQ